jgi:hypothetical protein
MLGATNVQLVSAPDSLVGSLGGVFSAMTSMAQVRAVGRDVSNLLHRRLWTIKTHRFGICTPAQRECAHSALLVGERLRTVDDCNGINVTSVPPNEVWVLILGWILRSELGSMFEN